MFEAVRKTGNLDVENELQPLLEAYRDAPSEDTKTQILSIYANRYPAKELIEIHKLFKPITEWELRKAKLHANNKGLGDPLEKPVYHRVRTDTVKVKNFLEFINGLYFYQYVSYGARTLKLDSGEKLLMHNVIRTVARSTMIAQYLQLCQEEDFHPLSRAALIRSARDMREALLQRPVQGVAAFVCEVKDKQKAIDVAKIPHISAYHNFEFEPQGIHVWKAYSVGQSKTVNYTDLVRKSQGPTSLVVKDGQSFFDISVKRNLKSHQPTRLQTSALFPCPKEGCNSSFPCFDCLQHHLDSGEHENTTSQESVTSATQLHRDWVARFSILVLENRPRPQSANIFSLSSSSLPLG